jgi:hypothetical protein
MSLLSFLFTTFIVHMAIGCIYHCEGVLSTCIIYETHIGLTE